MKRRLTSLSTACLGILTLGGILLSIPQMAGPLPGLATDDAIPTLAPSTAQHVYSPGPGTNATGQADPGKPGDGSVPDGMVQPPYDPLAKVLGPEIGRLRIHVIDGRSMRPLEGAEVVLIETEKRYTTDAKGYTQWFDAPIIRNPKYRPLVAELHGQLGVIVYKNGYRDSIHIGIRMHDNVPNETTVWMYKIGPGDTRIEPVLYLVPYHHTWLIELADRFRRKSQLGEGPERP